MAKDDRRSTLLRHRFSSVEQLKAHLHAVDGRSLLFFRDPTLMLAPGAPVLLEMVFAQSEQTRVVRATLVARAEGQGLWLAMPNTRFAREVHDRGLVPRRWRRLGADRPMRVRWPDGAEQMVTLLDLSIAGARIGGGLSRALEPGTEGDLRLASPEIGLSPDLGRATVVWSQDGEAGLQFDRASTTCRVSVGRLFQLLQQEWEKARSVDHVHGCCAGGALLEPPLPRLRVDGKNNDPARAKTG
ncbi:MAG: PilZ domain-containing protein [Deltaproteobacteria bacterium]|nr:MAG: PilZ domain-containing protein [Deltaproteobacteria bacterium]